MSGEQIVSSWRSVDHFHFFPQIFKSISWITGFWASFSCASRIAFAQVISPVDEAFTLVDDIVDVNVTAFAASGTLFGVLLPPRPIKVSLANLIFLAESEAEGEVVALGKGRFFPLQSPVVGESAATL